MHSSTHSKDYYTHELYSHEELEKAEKKYLATIKSEYLNSTLYQKAAYACIELKDYDASIQFLIKSIALNPLTPENHKCLGLVLQLMNKLNPAVNAYRIALKLTPLCSTTNTNLGIILKNLGNLHEACIHHQKAVEASPLCAQFHYNLGNTLKEMKKTKEAIKHFKQALSLDPNYYKAHNNIGKLYQENGELKQAIKSYGHAIKLNPNAYETHSNLGTALTEEGKTTDAFEALSRALELDPENSDTTWNMSLVKLIEGNYREGWIDYESRKKKTNPIQPYTTPSKKEWEGTPINKDELLMIIGEQSMSDVLHFIRYTNTLKAKGIRTSVCIQKNLHELIKVSGIDSSPKTPSEVSSIGNCQWVSLLSLPRILGVTRENPITNTPYLRTNKESINKWRSLLADEARPIVGLCWQGDPDHEYGLARGRSIKLKSFKGLADKHTGTFISFQKGCGSEQLEECTFKHKFVNCQKEIDKTWDFIETAAIIELCDYIITVDTIIAQLSAGIGKETWLLLKKVPDWRWGLNDKRTAWYPNMTLFRQTIQNDWEYVLKAIDEAAIHRNLLHKNKHNSQFR